MPITTADIKLLASEVMADTSDGGGAMTGNVIVDGQSNNLFDDISDIDRVYGAVNLRKAFSAVQTDTVDRYLGMHLIVARLPGDDKIGVTIFDTANAFDRRNAAQTRIESYLARGGRYSGYLWGTQFSGSRAVVLYQRKELTVPEVGDVFELIQNEGSSGEYSQFIRISKVTHQVQSFYLAANSCNNFERRIVTLEITDALRADYDGPEVDCVDRTVGYATMRNTVVADAAKYYGARKLAHPGVIGDMSIAVDSIFSQIVPSTQAETTVLDVYAGAEVELQLDDDPLIKIPIAAHTQRIEVDESNRQFNYVFILAPLPSPGSVVISYRSQGRWYSVADDGTGGLAGVGAGSVNYLTGSANLTCAALPDAGTLIIAQWAETSAMTNRSGQAGFRAPEYTISLPHKGVDADSLVVTWTSGGVVKTAASHAGVLSGHASGRLDAANGVVYLSPSAMPDAGVEFSLAYDYGDAAPLTETLTGLVADAFGLVNAAVSQPIRPGTLSLEWLTGLETSASSGTSVVTRTPGTPAVYGPPMVVEDAVWGWKSGQTGTVWQIIERRNVTQPGNLYRSATNPSTVVENIEKISEAQAIIHHTMTDNGAGGFLVSPSLGMVNYTSGHFTFKSTDGRNHTQYKSDGGGTGGGATWDNQVITDTFTSGAVQASYRPPSAQKISYTMPYAPTSVSIDLCPYTVDRIVPGSVQFTWMGKTYRDFEGSLYRGRTASNPGILSGTINYVTGLCTMTDYVVGAAGFTLDSLWTMKGDWSTARLFFRTSGAPVKPTGFVLSVIDKAGNQLTATSTVSGQITGTHIIGTIDYQTGVVALQFGDMKTATLLTDIEKAEWWYDPALIDADGKIFKPWPVDPMTARYNVVVYQVLPLRADILGLDPVRLPSDGKVPVIKGGDVVVIHHTATLALATYASGDTANCGRTRLSRIRVLDNGGFVVGADRYAADLASGTLTFTNVASLAQPLKVEHRIEDMALVSEVQITGAVTLTQPLTHAFPANETVVSSAMLCGNRFARAVAVFDQLTWTNVWSDAVIGSGTTSQYNTTQYPIAVTNKGALQERWAIIFTNTTAFRVVGENVGQIAIGDTTNLTAPINPATGAPYFTLHPEGWGGGWAAGNVLRFNTLSAAPPVWIIRSIGQGPATDTDYNFCLETRGNVDA